MKLAEYPDNRRGATGIAIGVFHGGDMQIAGIDVLAKRATAKWILSYLVLNPEPDVLQREAQRDQRNKKIGTLYRASNKAMEIDIWNHNVESGKEKIAGRSAHVSTARQTFRKAVKERLPEGWRFEEPTFSSPSFEKDRNEDTEELIFRIFQGNEEMLRFSRLGRDRLQLWLAPAVTIDIQVFNQAMETNDLQQLAYAEGLCKPTGILEGREGDHETPWISHQRSVFQHRLATLRDRLHTHLPSNDSSPEIRVLLAGLYRSADRARETMQPAILRHIPRPAALQPILDAVQKGRESQSPTAIFLLGPAGYGKTVMLGELCDTLRTRGQGWLGIVRADDVSFADTHDGERLDRAVGFLLGHTNQSATEIAAILSPILGPGVLVIDTLDLILNASLIPALHSLLHGLRQQNVTTVFSCRDADYGDYFLPSDRRLAGLSVCKVSVPPFTNEEVLAAAQIYFETNPGSMPPGGATEFATGITRLSEHDRPLRDITQSPLLLGILCELFGKEGVVPSDLTVSKLYNEYWERKVVQSRILKRTPVHVRRTQEARVKFCYDLAQVLFQRSTDRLYESVDPLLLEIARYRPREEAFRELRSEYVIEQPSWDRIRFFHQTFEEFAIACWLHAEAGRVEKQNLLSGLQGGQMTTKAHWWPVIRQLLVRMEESEFQQWAETLQETSIPAFRAVALATVARADGASYLPTLLPIALKRGPLHQDTLLLAINSSPTHLAAVTWKLLLGLLKSCGKPHATRVAMLIGAQLARQTPNSQQLEETLRTIDGRQPSMVGEPRGNRGDDRAEIIGKLLEGYRQGTIRSLSDVERHVFREHYGILSDDTRTEIVRLHLAANIDMPERCQLLTVAQGFPAPKALREEMAALVSDCLPGAGDNDRSSLWSWWLEIHTPDSAPMERWLLVYEKVMGWRAQNVVGLLDKLVEDLCFGDKDRTNADLIALEESARAHGAAAVHEALRRHTAGPRSPLRPGAIEFLSKALSKLNSDTPNGNRDDITAGKTVDELLIFARGAYPIQAARHLFNMAATEPRPDVDDLLLLLNSKIVGVRVYGVRGLRERLQQGSQFSQVQIAALCAALNKETTTACATGLCQLMGEWTRNTRRALPLIGEALGTLAPRMTTAGTCDSGVVRYVIESLNSLSRHAPPELLHRIGMWLQDLLDVTDMQKVGNWKKIRSTFARITGTDSKYLEALIGHMRQTSYPYATNVMAVAETINQVETRNSPTFDSLLKDPHCPEVVKAFIIDLRDGHA